MKKTLQEEKERITNLMEQLRDEPSHADSNTNFTNRELRALIGTMIEDLRYYDDAVAADIITAKLEEKYPQLKTENDEGSNGSEEPMDPPTLRYRDDGGTDGG